MIRTWTPESDAPKPPAGPDYRTVKAWFQQCRTLAAAVEAQREKIQRIRDVAGKCTQNLSGLPGGGSGGDKVGFAVEQLDTEQRELCRMEEQLRRRNLEATHRAAFLCGTERARRQADCIFRYYVLNERQRTVAEKLGFSNPTGVSVYIRDGFKTLAEIWPDIQNDEE